MSSGHQAVLLREAVAGLAIKEDGVYIDATYGRGGHSSEILAALGSQGRLVAIDRDVTAVNHAGLLAGSDERFAVWHGSFADILVMAEQYQLIGEVDGILIDCGVSSPQLDEAERGFSFMQSGPLDMRMDTTRDQTAAEWLASAKEADIVQALKQFGEERFARRIAAAIVARRMDAPLINTAELAALIKQAVPRVEKHKHPATRTFQALRIVVNDELTAIEKVLQASLKVLKTGGRLSVISFHSLEDRIVKRFIKQESEGPKLPRHVPLQYEDLAVSLRKIGKATKPSEEEVSRNPRARSAVLRVAEKIA